MSDEKGSLNSKTGAWIIIMLIISVFVPYVWHHYIQPLYVYAWYIFNSHLFNGLVWLSNHYPALSERSDSYLFWVDWVILDGHIKPHTMTQQIVDANHILSNVHAESIKSVYTSFTSKGKGYTSDFITISRFGFAILFPVYLFLSIHFLRKIVNYNEFKTIFTLDSFVTTLAEGFPENLPVVWDNPLKESDLDKGVWAMSPKILNYLREHECIVDFTENGNKKIKLETEVLRELLVSQLGNRWSGFEDLSPECKKVIALALPMIKSPKEGSRVINNLIRMYGYAYSSKPNFSNKAAVFGRAVVGVINPISLIKSKGMNILRVFSSFFEIRDGISESCRQQKYMWLSNREVKRVLKKYAYQDCVTQIVNHHAYEYTVIAALIRKARDGGKIPSCTCIWLKKKDRPLFYMFNNLGREVGWIEVCGFWSHDMSEKTIKVPFSYPRVDAAISGIDEYLAESYYEYVPIFDWDSE